MDQDDKNKTRVKFKILDVAQNDRITLLSLEFNDGKKIWRKGVQIEFLQRPTMEVLKDTIAKRIDELLPKPDNWIEELAGEMNKEHDVIITRLPIEPEF